MAFTVEFATEEAEQVRASRAMLHRRCWTRLVYVVLPLFPIAMLGSDIYWGSLQRRGWWPNSTIILLFAFAVGVSLLIYMAPYLEVRSSRKNNRAASGSHRYVLNSNGLETTSSGVRTHLEWPNVVEAYENSEFLFLYVSAGNALFIPKRVVARGELPSLRQAIRRWVGERTKLLDDPPA